jgi:hypothetical protein
MNLSIVATCYEKGLKEVTRLLELTSQPAGYDTAAWIHSSSVAVPWSPSTNSRSRLTTS